MMKSNKQPFMSIAVPTHAMENGGHFLIRLLESLWTQTYQNFEIVVTDNSDNDIVQDICEYYKTGIRYSRNPVMGMAPNTNEAIQQSRGELIKILYMDDYLLHDMVLESIVGRFKGEWLICGADDNPDPHYTRDIHQGNNKLGSPSALTIRNNDPILFDEKLTWLLDCDLYHRYHQKFGEPVIVHGKHIGIGKGPHQLTHILSAQLKSDEFDYLMQKHA